MGADTAAHPKQEKAGSAGKIGGTGPRLKRVFSLCTQEMNVTIMKNILSFWMLFSCPLYKKIAGKKVVAVFNTA
jgi:hypothetical protein